MFTHLAGLRHGSRALCFDPDEPAAVQEHNVVRAVPASEPADSADLCADFIKTVSKIRNSDWIAYPETADWDILLVRRSDGLQIGIEAKLRLNLKVLSQALPSNSVWTQWRGDGPDCRAVLVPRGACNTEAAAIAKYLGITVIKMGSMPDEKAYFPNWDYVFYPQLPDEDRDSYDDDWFDFNPLIRCDLPEYIPDVGAGGSAPVKLTEWKIKAIRLSVLLEKRGYLTAADFKHFRCSMSRWTQGGLDYCWLQRGSLRGQWVRGPNIPDFRAQHPVNYAEIEADFRGFAAALDAGIATVYQDLAMIPLMSITRNFFMGREPLKGVGPFKYMDMTHADAVTREEMHRIGIDVRDPQQAVGTLSGGERQCVAIARAVYFGAKVLILDEPTSALGVAQTSMVLKYINQVRAKGLGVIFITHNVRHAYAVGDRFTVLNRGRTLGTHTKNEITIDALQNLMAGGKELQDLGAELGGTV
mgnify:CR=1 FL=1